MMGRVCGVQRKAMIAPSWVNVEFCPVSGPGDEMIYAFEGGGYRKNNQIV